MANSPACRPYRRTITTPAAISRPPISLAAAAVPAPISTIIIRSRRLADQARIASAAAAVAAATSSWLLAIRVSRPIMAAAALLAAWELLPRQLVAASVAAWTTRGCGMADPWTTMSSARDVRRSGSSSGDSRS